MDKKTAITNCNNIKGILMLIVVLGHSCAFWAKQNWFSVECPVYESEVLYYISKFISHFHVYTFTFVSGYIFSYVKNERNGYKSIKELLLKKTKRLLIPYISVLILWVIPFYYFFYNPTIDEILTRFVLGSHVNQLWFLLMLFETFIILWVLTKYIKSEIVILLITLSMNICGVVLNQYIINYFQICRTLQYVIFAFLGYVFCSHKININGIRLIIVFVVDVLLFILSLIVHNQYINKGVELVSNIVGTISAFYLLNRLCDLIGRHVVINETINNLSKYSMGIYLFHQQIIWLSISFLNGKVNPVTHAMVNFITSLLICLGLTYILDNGRRTKKIIGV